MKHWISTCAGILGLSLLLTACTIPPASTPSSPTATTPAVTTSANGKEPPMTNQSPIVQTITAANGTKLIVDLQSTIFQSPANTWGNGTNYPTVIQLQHQGSRQGVLLTTFEVADSGLAGRPTCFRIIESTDDGKTWKKISEVTETLDLSLEACWNPQLYELPAPLGDLPAGTLLLAGVSIDPAQKVKSQISLWISTDGGRHWTQKSIVAQGKGVEEGGVWEPFLLWEEERLYCFYSDETMNGHDQAIVYRTTEDGTGWSDPVPVVAAENPLWRPGMVGITRMGNGKYFMVYEVFGDWEGCPIYYKTTRSLTDWNASEIGTRLTATDGYSVGSAPCCLWTPAGGACGTLLVTAVYGSASPNKLLVSFDYGKTFEALDNPLPYTDGRGGYSASLFLSADGKTVYYANNVDSVRDKSRIALARIRIESPI